MEPVQLEFRYCRVSELKRLLFTNNLGKEARPGGFRGFLRTMQRTRGPLLLEVKEPSRVDGNRGQEIRKSSKLMGRLNIGIG